MEVALELTYARNSRPSCVQAVARSRGWCCPGFWGHGDQRGQWEPTIGGCPNWMTSQEVQAGAPGSLLQLATNTSATVRSRG